MKNTLYLREMGMNDNTIPGDIKNHRIRTIENIDIVYKGTPYNMFFEFTTGTHYNYRTTNKRTGKPLKKMVQEVILTNGLYIDTEYKKDEVSGNYKWKSSWRNSDLEREIFREHHAFTKKDILEVVNRYKTGEKFTDICLVETAAADIIRKKGGYREKDIFNTNSYFEIGETWTADHKTMRCNKRERVQTATGSKLEVTDFCEVDLVTGNITL